MPKRKKQNLAPTTAEADGTRVMKTRGENPQFFRGARLMVPEDEVGGTFDEITDLKKRRFLEALSEMPRIGRACKLAGVTQTTLSRWKRDGDQQFLQAYEVAWAMGVDRAESELWRRGVEGVEKPVYQQGRLVGTVREYDTQAAMFMLRGARPEKFREKSAEGAGTTHVGSVTNVTVQLAGLSTEELKARLAQATKALDAGAVIDAEVRNG